MDKQKILVVDDTPLNIKILNELLKEQYHVSAVTNGQKALDIANSDQRPDLILLNITMPDMDGYEVCGRLKADKHTMRFPLFLLLPKLR